MPDAGHHCSGWKLSLTRAGQGWLPPWRAKVSIEGEKGRVQGTEEATTKTDVGGRTASAAGDTLVLMFKGESWEVDRESWQRLPDKCILRDVVLECKETAFREPIRLPEMPDTTAEQMRHELDVLMGKATLACDRTSKGLKHLVERFRWWQLDLEDLDALPRVEPHLHQQLHDMAEMEASIEREVERVRSAFDALLDQLLRGGGVLPRDDLQLLLMRGRRPGAAEPEWFAPVMINTHLPFILNPYCNLFCKNLQVRTPVRQEPRVSVDGVPLLTSCVERLGGGDRMLARSVKAEMRRRLALVLNRRVGVGRIRMREWGIACDTELHCNHLHSQLSRHRANVLLVALRLPLLALLLAQGLFQRRFPPGTNGAGLNSNPQKVAEQLHRARKDHVRYLCKEHVAQELAGLCEALAELHAAVGPMMPSRSLLLRVSTRAGEPTWMAMPRADWRRTRHIQKLLDSDRRGRSPVPLGQARLGDIGDGTWPRQRARVVAAVELGLMAAVPPGMRAKVVQTELGDGVILYHLASLIL